MERKLNHERMESGDIESSRRSFGQWFNERCLPSMKKAALLVALPVVVAVSADCGGRTRPVDDYREPDAQVDVGPDGDVDSDVDGDAENEVDGDADDVVDGDVDADSDSDMDLTGLVMEPLIGDHLNRRLGDRMDNIHGDTDTGYPAGGSDSSENANPFTDGAGGTLGPSETFMHRIDGTHTELLEDVMLNDLASGDIYLEEQSVWVRGDTHFDFDVDEVVARVDFVAYAVRLSQAGSDSRGIPVCTEPVEGTDYRGCLGLDWDLATASHRMEVYFLGEPWVLLRMDAPSAELDNEHELVNGGRVVLGKEAMGGIINQDESLVIDGLRFTLTDVEEHGGASSAIITISDDATGEVLERDVVGPGQTKDFSIMGESYMLHVYNAAPGYTMDAKWAHMAILSQRLELEDGHELNMDEDDNPGWTVALGWKNREGNAVDAQPDELRLISVYSDDVAEISTSGDEELQAGDFFTIVTEPASWEFAYAGLNVTSEERQGLEIELVEADGVSIPESRGPVDRESGDQVACEIYAPYVYLNVGGYGSLVLRDVDEGGDGHGDHAILAASGAHCEGSIGDLGEGALFIPRSPSSDDMAFRRYRAPGQVIEFENAGSGTSWESGGVIVLSSFADTDAATSSGPIAGMGIIDSREGPFRGDIPDFVIAISEDAGAGHVDRLLVPVYSSGSPAGLEGDLSNTYFEPIFSYDSLSYQAAGPVSTGTLMVDEGYVTERGSVFSRITDTEATFQIADRVVHTAFFLVPYVR